jgi:hypothetical protein
MTSKNKNLVYLLIGALLLFSFKNAKKRKGSIIIEPDFKTQNLYALVGSKLYAQDRNTIIYTFNYNLQLELIENTGIDYKINYVTPSGKTVTGYINYYDVEIK